MPYMYTLNAKGQRVHVEEQPTGRTMDYAYDAADRLVEEHITDPGLGNRTISYTYDPVGNRLTKTDNGVITTYFKRLVFYCNSKSCRRDKKNLNFSLTSFILRLIEQIAQVLCMSCHTCLTSWRSLKIQGISRTIVTNRLSKSTQEQKTYEQIRAVSERVRILE